MGKRPKPIHVVATVRSAESSNNSRSSMVRDGRPITFAEAAQAIREYLGPNCVPCSTLLDRADAR